MKQTQRFGWCNVNCIAEQRYRGPQGKRGKKGGLSVGYIRELQKSQSASRSVDVFGDEAKLMRLSFSRCHPAARSLVFGLIRQGAAEPLRPALATQGLRR
jgi:hypothetical protein